ncbi:hypothetical protein Trydic_g22131, partial [Trypoxylus dichotomus]
LHVSHKIILQN